MNSFREFVSCGEPRVGMWLALSSAYVAEVCADAGFDWMLIDCEHGPNDVASVLAQLQVLAGLPVQPVVRSRNGDLGFIRLLIDMGAKALMVPMINTADQAREVVSLMRYPPRGNRGMAGGLIRASRWGRTHGYAMSAERELTFIAQIETREAVDNIDAILTVDGVDAVFIGPADLAANMGHLGNAEHPEVLATIHLAINKAHHARKPVGGET